MFLEIDQDMLMRAGAALGTKADELGVFTDEETAVKLAMAAITSILADIVAANPGTKIEQEH